MAGAWSTLIALGMGVLTLLAVSAAGSAAVALLARLLRLVERPRQEN